MRYRQREGYFTSAPNWAAVSIRIYHVDNANPRGRKRSKPSLERHSVMPTWCRALDATVPTGKKSSRRSIGRWRFRQIAACGPLTDPFAVEQAQPRKKDWIGKETRNPNRRRFAFRGK